MAARPTSGRGAAGASTSASGDGTSSGMPSILPPGVGLSTGTGRTDPSREAVKGEMPFLDHLEELRWRIFKGLGGVLVCVVACLFFTDWILDTILLGPTRADFFMYDTLRLSAVDIALQNRTITGQFFAFFGTVLAVGLVLGSPIVLYQAWKFIEPALYPKEKEGMRFAAAFATFFFVLGVSFGYLIITPIALQFFAQFEVSDQIINEFDISRYFSMVVTWAFGAGVLFELPVVVTFLAKAGLVTTRVLRVGRKYAIVVILVLGALFTPPDPLSQILLAVPLLGLYELAILLAGVVERRHQREAEREAAEEAARAATSE
ncbi:MAG: twin-arginine translocase subunit TatC [Bacteroidota bacterium]